MGHLPKSCSPATVLWKCARTPESGFVVSLPVAESLAVRYCRSLEARAMDFRLRQGTTTPSTARFDHPLLCGEGNLPLLKSFKGAILASKPPGIWRMSVRAL